MIFTPEERERRRSGIGASEAGAVLGLSPFRTPTEVWLEKVGLSEPQADSPALEWGRRLEPVVLAKYAETAGVLLTPASGPARHPGVPVLFATPDAVRPDGALVEAKTTTSDEGWGEPGTDEVPEHYLVQVAVQMACCGAPACEVAVLNLRRRAFAVYHVERDLDLEAVLLPRLAAWWEQYVVLRTPPQETGAVALARWPRERAADLVPAPADAIFWLDVLRRARDERKRIEEAEAEAADALKALIGPAAGLVAPDGVRVTWKANPDRRVTDWQAVAAAAGATPEHIAAHTTTKPGPRVFRPTWPEPKQLEAGE